MNTPETEELPTPTQAAPAAAEGAKPKARIKAPDAPQKPRVAPVKAKPTSLAEAAKKAPRVSRNAARTGSKNPVSARRRLEAVSCLDDIEEFRRDHATYGSMNVLPLFSQTWLYR